jgi:hypothetical protein
MPSSSNIRAGRAYVELGADSNAFIKDMKKAESAFNSFGKTIAKVGAGITAAGGAITGALGVALGTFSEMGDELAKASKRTGISVEALSQLKFAAQQSGVSFDQLLPAIGKMQKSIAGVADETEGTTGKLDKLGLTTEALAGLSPDQQFAKVADSIASIADPAERTAAAMSVFGRGGAALLPLLTQGSKGVRALMQEATDLGIVMTTKDALAAEQFHDAMLRLWTQVKVVTFTIGGAIADALLPFQRAANQAGRAIIDFAQSHKQLAVTAGLVGIALTVVGTAITGFGIAIIGIGATLGVVTGLLEALLTPLGLLSAVVVGAASAFFFLSDSGNKALSYLGRQFTTLRDTAATAFGGITDALAAGDIALAGKIVVTELKIGWIELKGALTAIFDAIGQNLVIAWTKAIAEVKILWQKLRAFVQIPLQTAADRIQLNDKQADIDEQKRQIGYTQNTIDSKDSSESDKESARKFIGEQQARLKKLEEEKKYMEDLFKKSPPAVAQETADAIAAIEKERDAKLAAIEQISQKGSEAEANQQKQDLADLEEKLKKLREKAKEESPPGTNEPPPTSTPPTFPKFDTNDISKSVLKASEQSRGLFNIAGLQGLQSGTTDYARRTADAADRTARNTDFLARVARTGGGLIYTA